MNRKEITRKLSNALEYHLNPNCDPRFYIAKEVTLDYNSDHPVRVDYMQFKPLNNTVSGIEKGDFYCYEIKSSVEDFKSKNGHNFIGDYNYYVMTRETYLKIDSSIPWEVGVLIIDEGDLDNEFPRFLTVKNSKRKMREKSVSELLLMMFRSSNRENIKRNKEIRKEKLEKFLKETIENN